MPPTGRPTPRYCRPFTCLSSELGVEDRDGVAVAEANNAADELGGMGTKCGEKEEGGDECERSRFAVD